MQESKRQLIVIGYSGHAMALIESAIELNQTIFGYTENDESLSNPFDLKYLGQEGTDSFQHFTSEYDFAIGIGDNAIRTKISTFLRAKSEQLINIIDKTAVISKTVKMGTGNFIAKNTTISTLAELGNDIIINTSASIDHHCKISDGVHIAPGAVLCGNVEVGSKTFIGANATIKQGVRIGSNVVIGAGAVVLKDISNNDTFVGNPAKKI